MEARERADVRKRQRVGGGNEKAGRRPALLSAAAILPRSEHRDRLGALEHDPRGGEGGRPHQHDLGHATAAKAAFVGVDGVGAVAARFEKADELRAAGGSRPQPPIKLPSAHGREGSEELANDAAHGYFCSEFSERIQGLSRNSCRIDAGFTAAGGESAAFVKWNGSFAEGAIRFGACGRDAFGEIRDNEPADLGR